MSEEIPDVISPFDGSNSDTAMAALGTSSRHEDEQLESNGAASSQNNEPPLDDIDNEEEPRRPLAADSEDDDDDDGIQVTIGNFEVEASTFAANRLRSRGMLPGGPIVPQLPPAAPSGPVNGQLNFDHDAPNAYKDEDKPWKKPGADITDYFNYGFTDETWAKYSDRQRRLRYENSLARLNPVHAPPMYLGHPPMMHPINPHPGMMMNRPFNPQMVPRPMTNRRPDGRIDVIGTTDQTSRRAMMETPNGFDPPPNSEGHPLPNGQTVDVHHSGPAAGNGTPPDGVRHIPSIAAHRPPMMPMPFRPGYVHAPGSPHFFRYGPGVEMHGDRFPRPYFVPRHPHPGWNNGMGPMPGFAPGAALPPGVGPENAHDPRAGSGRGATPENDASRSSTPEERRPVDENGSALAIAGEQEKSAAEDQFKDRYRDDRDRHYSSRHTRHRGSEHEYERPRNDRRSSRERDDKYGSSSRRRNGRGDDEPSRSQRSSRRTPTKRESSPSKVSSTEPSQASSANAPSSSSPNDRSRHSQHKKSSKRSRHDSDSERSSSRHHHSHRRRSPDKSSSSNKKAKHHTEPSADHTEPSKA